MFTGKFTVGSFESFAKGPLCHKPCDGGPPIALDRNNEVKPHPRMKYLIQVVHMAHSSKIRFGKIIKSEAEIFDELLPLLVQAKWERAKDLFANHTAIITSPIYGAVEAGFYLPSRGRYGVHPYVEVKFRVGEAQVALTESGPSIDELKHAVERAVGPAIDLGAVIARRRNMNSNHW